MRKMKDSGITWIGEIPTLWETRKLKHIVVRKNIKNKSSEEVLSLYRDLGVIIKSSRSDNHNVTSDDTSNYNFVEVFDLVVNKMKTWQGSLAVSDYQGIISPAYYVCKITEFVHPRYLHYLLRNISYHAEYRRLSAGVRPGQWDLSYDDLKMIPIVCPPISTQKIISNFLDEKTEKIDATIEREKQHIEKLREYRQTLISEAVTKGLNSSVVMRDSGISWVGDIPKKWSIIKLRFISSIATGNKNSEDRADTGMYPFYVRSPKIERINSYSFEGKAILMAGDGVGAGKVFHYANGKFDYHQRVYNIHKIETVEPKYLFYYLMINFPKKIKEANAKSTVDSIRLPMLLSFPICVPSKDEQFNIVTFLDKKTLQIDSVIAKKEVLISKLQEYKKSLIYETVTGKIDIPENS